MSDQETTSEVEKITAPLEGKRIKNPKRVAAGKALAAKNKERLEKLKERERKLLEQPRDESPETTPSQPLNKTDQKYLWLAGGLLITLGAGYTIARLTCNQQSQPPPPPPPPPPQPQEKIKFVEDDF